MCEIHWRRFCEPTLTLPVMFVLLLMAGCGMVGAQPLSDALARTLEYHNTPPNAEGDFHFEFQTSNGITTKANGNRYGHSGVVQYISLEGIPVTVTYIADANGYQPTGDHIPKTPEQVLASLRSLRIKPKTNH